MWVSVRLLLIADIQKLLDERIVLLVCRVRTHYGHLQVRSDFHHCEVTTALTLRYLQRELRNWFHRV